MTIAAWLSTSSSRNRDLRLTCCLLLLCALPCGSLWADTIGLVVDEGSPQARFAADELEAAVIEREHEVRRVGLEQLAERPLPRQIVLCLATDPRCAQLLIESGGRAAGELTAEGFSLRRTGAGDRETLWILGADPAGLMYGGLEAAEQIRIGGLRQVQETDQNPYMAMRGTKFNAPLDVRTPSYSDVSDAAQHNIAEMWSLDFWMGYIDSLARHRFNFISLWSLHPFPSLVQVPEYPDIALADVQRSTVNWQEHYSLNGIGFDAPEILGRVDVLKRMSVGEKIAFWREVMRYGKERNVDFYFVTWNIFVNGTAGQYGITDDIANPITTDYFRRSVKQMFLTYPDLKGIGLTTGENLHGASFEEKEAWAFDTYAGGVLDAAAEQPGRRITFIHRQHETGALDIARKFRPLIDHPDIEFIFSFKYAQAHVFSSTTQVFHPGFVRDLEREGGLKTIWTLRNDDNYRFRWGAPDFVREFIRNIPYDVSRGFYYGSDQYIWAREFMSLEPESPRQLEVDKHWYHWMLWGRLGYNPDLSNDRLRNILQVRFPSTDVAKLFDAWQHASLIYPLTTGFHWGALDFQWYIEACKSRPGPAGTPSGFHDVNRFISLPPHPGTDFVSIPDYVDSVVEQKQTAGTTPFEVAARIHEHADRALAGIESLPVHSKQLRHTREDIRAMAFLGKYYAFKIEGATELELSRRTSDPAHRAAAIQALARAAKYWRLYAATGLGMYRNRLWTNRVGYSDWRELFEHVVSDLTQVGGEEQMIPSASPTPGGALLEAETAASSCGIADDVPGFTGTGYRDTRQAQGPREMAWTFRAEHDGPHILEFRYAAIRPEALAAPLQVNGRAAGDLVMWHTGSNQTWAWDRITVTLQNGDNHIVLHPGDSVLVDHLNVLAGEALSGSDPWTSPIVPPSLVFEEKDGLVAIEAEHFYEQRLNRERAWYITTQEQVPDVEPDGDPSHIAGASGGAYVEALPDTRRTHDDELIHGVNFSDEPGKIAILSYKVHFNTPGTYWLWARAFSTTSEDNGLHFGINGEWPDTAKKWQTVTRDRWHWKSAQRTDEVHTGVPGILTLEVPSAGEHTIEVSMREDGTALDKILLAHRKDYTPEGLGPDPAVKSGSLPPTFEFVPATAEDEDARDPRQPGSDGAVEISE